MNVLDWGFGEDSHKVEDGTGCLSTLRTLDTGDNGGHSIHKLGQGDQWENRRDEMDHL